MVALNKYSGGQTLPQVRQPRVVADTAVGQALQGFGADITSAGANIGRTLSERQAQRDQFQLNKGLLDFQSQNLDAEVNLQQNMRPMADGYEADALADFDKRSEAFLESMPEGVRKDAELKIQGLRNQFQGRAKTNEIKERNRYYRNEIATSQDNLLQGLSRDPESYEEVLEAGRTLIQGSELIEAEKKERIQEWERLAALAWAERLPAPERQRLFGRQPQSGSEIGGLLMGDLMRDFGLTREQAAGFVGNLAHESGDFQTLQEISPTVPGSRGGFGYAQWTGPRRVAFEKYVEENGLDPNSYEANYGFLRYELENTAEGNVLTSLREAQTADEATRIVANSFLRPGIVNMESRLRRANQQLGREDIPDEYRERYDALSYEDTVRLGDQADKDMVRASGEVADAYRLGIQLAPNEIQVADIVADPLMDNGQKASLIKELRATLKKGADEREAIAWVSSPRDGNPYSTQDKKRANDAYTALSEGASEQDVQAIGQQITASTGVIPSGYVNYLRGGITSTNQNDAYQAARQSYDLMQLDPQAVDAAENGGDIATAAQKYDFYQNELGLSPAETGKRLAAMNDPETIRERDLLMKSAPVQEELKKVDQDYVEREIAAGMGFLTRANPFSGITLGADPRAAAILTAEYKEIFEESIYETSGDLELAKSLARFRFSRLNQTSEFSLADSGTVTKYPIESTYPMLPDLSRDYVRKQAIAALAEEGIETDAVYFQAYDETGKDFDAGRPPAYILYYDKDGEQLYYNYPFRADYQSALDAYNLGQAAALGAAVEESRQERDENLERRFFGREDSLREFTEGVQLPPPMQTVPEEPEEQPRGATAARRQRRQESIERMQEAEAAEELARQREREDEERIRRELEERRNQ